MPLHLCHRLEANLTYTHLHTAIDTPRRAFLASLHTHRPARRKPKHTVFMSILSRLPILGILIVTTFLFTACNSTARLLDANTSNLKTARTVAAAFYKTYGEDLGLRDVPFVTVGLDGGQGYSYDIDHNVLFITPFSHIDFDTQKIFAKACANDRGDDVYNDLMFRYFTAHQLMHLFYDKLQLEEVSLYDEEMRINTLTLLFLKQHDLLSTSDKEIHSALSEIEQKLKRRFPQVMDGNESPATMVVDDNAAYWFVTACNMREARFQASMVSSSKQYLEGLRSPILSAGAGQ